MAPNILQIIISRTFCRIILICLTLNPVALSDHFSQITVFFVHPIYDFIKR